MFISGGHFRPTRAVIKASNVYLRTTVRTLRPLKEDIETDVQTGPMGLLDVMAYFAYRSARSAHNLTVSPWFLQQNRCPKSM